MEPGLVIEHSGGVGVGKIARSGHGHFQDGVGGIVIFQNVLCEALQDLRAVDGAYSEVCGGRGVDSEFRAAPIVPVESGDSIDRIPEVGRHPDAKVAGRDVVVWRDDDGLVDVFRRVV